MSKLEKIWIVAVLVIIIGATTFNMMLSQRRSRDAQRKADLRGIAEAVEKFHDEFTYYPQELDGKIVACGDPAYRDERYHFDICDWSNNITPLLFYEPGRLPLDPKHSEGWQYRYTSDGTSYKLLTSLEDEGDEDFNPEVVNLGLICGNKVCNFAVVSKNVVY